MVETEDKKIKGISNLFSEISHYIIDKNEIIFDGFINIELKQLLQKLNKFNKEKDKTDKNEINIFKENVDRLYNKLNKSEIFN